MSKKDAEPAYNVVEGGGETLYEDVRKVNGSCGKCGSSDIVTKDSWWLLPLKLLAARASLKCRYCGYEENW